MACFLLKPLNFKELRTIDEPDNKSKIKLVAAGAGF